MSDFQRASAVTARWRLPSGLLLAVVVVLATLVQGGYAERPERPGTLDASEYLSIAHNLVTQGVFSQKQLLEEPVPGLGREPGYPLVLALLMKLDPGFARYTPGCTLGERRCNDIYVVPQWANAFFVALAGALVVLTCRLFPGGLFAGWACGCHIWLNFEAYDGLFYLMSDYLAMLLVALTVYLGVRTWQAGRNLGWIGFGAAAAALTLTKAIFLYLALPLAALCLVVLAVWRKERKRLLAMLLLSGGVYAALVGGWMLRNHEVGETFSITVSRGGVALSIRAGFNDVTREEYLASFVYWTRGFGNDLAKSLFGEAALHRLSEQRADGFLRANTHAYHERVIALRQEEGLSQPEAEAEIDRQLRAEILGNLPLHLVTTLPLLYRGIWLDEFVVLSLPALLALCFWALRRRAWLVLLALSPGLFSLVFYPLFTLPITRYQMTTLPILALATGWLVARAFDAIRRARDARSR